MTIDKKEIELRIRSRFEGQKTLTELVDGIKELDEVQQKQSADATKGTANTKELERTYQKLERSLRAVSAAYTETRRYEKQGEAVTAKGKVLDEARAKQEAFAASLVKGAELTAKQTVQQDRLAAAVLRAGGALDTARLRLDASAARLKEYGIDTGKLADAQARMVATIANGNLALKAQEDAIDKAVSAQKRMSGNELSSSLGRIKGQLVGMAAAYIGVHQAASLAGGSVEAYSSREGVKNQLALSVGNDRAAVDAEYEYVKGQSTRIGLEYERAAKGYAKFAAAASMAGKTRAEIRYIWEAFAEVGRVANLSTDDLDGVFKALEQITSKGKIQAEELRGQLGDRLFGAFQVAAKALKDTFPDLDKAMQNGEVTSEQLLLIAEEYRRTVAEELPAAMKSLSAEQARMTNSIVDFKLAIADAGFAEAFRKALVTITAALRTEDGKRFAEGLAAGFTAAADAVVWLLQNSQQVLIVLEAIAGLFAINAAGKAVKGVLDLSGGLKLLVTDIRLVIKELGLLRGALSVLQAAFVGWEIGKFLNEQFVEVRLAGVALVIGLETLWTRLKYSTQIVWAELPNIILDALSAVGNGATSLIRSMLGAFSSAARALGKNDFANSIDKALLAMELRTNRIGSASGQLTRQMEADLARIREIGNQMADEALAGPQALSSAVPGAVASPLPGRTKSAGKPDAKASAEFLKLKEDLESQIRAIDLKAEREGKEVLSRRLDAIDQQYAELKAKIAKVGGADGQALMGSFNAAVGKLKLEETKNFNDALLKEQMELQRKLEQVDAAAGRSDKTDLDKRLEAVRLSYEQTYRDIEAFRQKLIANGRDTAPADAAKGRLDGGVTALQNMERMKYYQDAVNAILEERKAKLDVIAVQEKTGLLTAVQARERAAEVVSETQPKLEALTALALEYVDAMIQAAEAMGASTTALDTIKAKLLESQNSAKGLRTEFISAAQVNEMLTNGATTAFGTMAQAIGGAVTGMHSWGDAVKTTRNAFLKFAADFLMQIGQMILKTMILKAIQNSGVGGPIAEAVNTLVKHDGGVVASGGRNRNVSPFVFTGAPRYHTGGIAGLAPDEYPAILQRNEEVLRANDPRNVLNGGKAAQGEAGAQGGQPIKIINMIDSGSVVSEGLSTPSGEKAIFNFIRANRTGLKQILG